MTVRPRQIVQAGRRPAFYALRSGGWRDYATLLHPPYTAWHVGYVAIGAGLAPVHPWPRLGAVALAFFLAVGIGAHALDEIQGRPLGTAIPRPVLIALAGVSIAAATGIGLYGAVTTSGWLFAFVAAGVFIVLAYNLELFGGRFHTDTWFALAWGSFPLLTGYFACSLRIGAAAIAGAVFAWALSRAQRSLSSEVRALRRNTTSVTGTITARDGSRHPITPAGLLRGPERALAATAAAVCLLAIALLVR